MESPSSSWSGIMVDEAQDPHSNFSRETVLDITLFSITTDSGFLGLTGFALPKPGSRGGGRGTAVSPGGAFIGGSPFSPGF
ncbi:hypothetical protein QQP08_000922 [Theobroma cacao]|nr:hypothetical protein QQP08_000922 [Theobroma cacao]